MRTAISALLVRPFPARLPLPLRRNHRPRVPVASHPPPPRSCSAMESARVDDDGNEKAEEEPAPAAEPSSPPLLPPEKPLPGDCCGSGCVRCVWDIYYDELEAYSKSLASRSKSPQS